MKTVLIIVQSLSLLLFAGIFCLLGHDWSAWDAIDSFFLLFFSSPYRFAEFLQSPKDAIGESVPTGSVRFISIIICSLGCVNYQRFWLSIFPSSSRIEKVKLKKKESPRIGRNSQTFRHFTSDHWIESCKITQFDFGGISENEREAEISVNSRWKIGNKKWEYFSAITRFNELSLSQFHFTSIVHDFGDLRYLHWLPSDREVSWKTAENRKEFNFQFCKKKISILLSRGIFLSCVKVVTFKIFKIICNENKLANTINISFE